MYVTRNIKLERPQGPQPQTWSQWEECDILNSDSGIELAEIMVLIFHIFSIFLFVWFHYNKQIR